MKKLSLLLAALLLVPALARAEMYSISDVREQAQALGRWTQTYTDRYGREVVVDVAPMIPEIEKVPVLLTERPDITDECIFNVLDESLTAKSIEDERIVYDYFNPNTNEKVRIILGTIGARTFIITYDNLNTKIEEDPNKLEIHKGIPYLSNEVELSRAYFDGCDLTIQDCMNLAREQLSAYFPRCDLDFDLTRVEVIHNSRPSYDCVLRQSMHGIPILMCASDPVLFLQDDDVDFKLPSSWMYSEAFRWGDFTRPCWEFTAFTDGGYGIQFCPLRENAVITDDVPLSSLDQVKESIEERIKAGNIRNVHALRFGYCCYLSEAGETVLYPVWQIECDYFYHPKEELKNYAEQDDCPVTSRLNYRTMIVNAQTGEFMDPIELKDRLLDCPEIITWEDAL